MSFRLHGSLVLLLLVAAVGRSAETDPLLHALRSVGREGAGNVEAARAWRKLTAMGPDVLPAILNAADGADAIAANWLRTAGDTIAQRTLAGHKSLPMRQLEHFLSDRSHSGPSRRLAYEWLCRADPATPRRLLPGMLDDPSPELRRDAVDAVMAEGKRLLDRGDRAGAGAAYRKAFRAAGDPEQVDALADRLARLGIKVDRAEQLGFVRQWQIVAPFDNRGEKGFSIVYPPEKGLPLGAEYKGKDGAPVRWLTHTTSDPHGLLDLNKVVGKQQGVIAYACAAIEVPRERRVQVRAGSPNAFKVFVNGKEVCRRNEYHHGEEIDQHTGTTHLHAGRNLLVVKVCQDEEKEAWAQTWQVQLRLCDDAGVAVPFTVVSGSSAQPQKEKGKP